MDSLFRICIPNLDLGLRILLFFLGIADATIHHDGGFDQKRRCRRLLVCSQGRFLDGETPAQSTFLQTSLLQLRQESVVSEGQKRETMAQETHANGSELNDKHSTVHQKTSKQISGLRGSPLNETTTSRLSSLRPRAAFLNHMSSRQPPPGLKNIHGEE